MAVSDIINLFTGTALVSGKGVTTTQITGQSGFPTTVTTLLNNEPAQNSNMPRAGINWVILDEQFKWAGGGFDMVGTAVGTTGTFKTHTVTGINIPKNGYVYIYCSNESQYSVFFDNLQVVHDRSPMLEETHYYPFGLTMSGISSKAAGMTPNRRKYNGKELQSGEFSDGSGLEWLSYGARMYDPQIGRFHIMDPLAPQFPRETPYSYGGNNPISNIDVDGMFKFSKETERFLKQHYPKVYKFISSKDGIEKMASNPKLLSLFEKLGFNERQVKEDFTYRSGAEIRVADASNGYFAQTPEAFFGKVIEINSKVLDVLEGAKTPEEIEAGLFAVTEELVHEEGHRVSLLLFGEKNHYTQKEDGAWLSEQMWGNLKSYYSYKTQPVFYRYIVEWLRNWGMRLVKEQKEENKPLPNGDPHINPPCIGCDGPYKPVIK